MSTSVAVIGTGYVGLTTGACLSHLGHNVICADIDQERVDTLQAGNVPFYEPGLAELVREGVQSGRLSFVLGGEHAVVESEMVFLCVPTPQADDGSVDLSYIEAAAASIAPVLRSSAVVVNKSTVPVGSAAVVDRIIARPDVTVVSNPEFLREGSAVSDFLHPDRVVIGTDSEEAGRRVAELYASVDAPILVTDPASAETIKYAANAFLATKISFVNAIAAVCEAVGADIADVVKGLGYDKRIGREFLNPGPGWGGSCFDGGETLMVLVDGSVRLVRFDEIRGLVENARFGVEALAWSPGQVRPEFRPVVAVTCRPYDGDMIHVRTKMGRRVRVTADHPMVVRDDDGITSIVAAGDLTERHWLPVSLNEPLLDAAAPSRLKMESAAMAAGIDPDRIIVRLTDEQRAAVLRVDAALPWTRRYDVRRCGAMKLSELQALGIDDTTGSWGTVTNGTYSPATIPTDEAFWFVIGLYLAEGHIGTDGARRRICWAFHPTDEDDLVDAVHGFWTSHGVKATVRSLSTTRQVSVSSRLLAALFDDVLRLGTNCYEHRIPDLAWRASMDAQRALLAGLWRGDGSWSLIAGGPSVALEYGTVSRALADGMVRMLAQHGIVARLKVGRTTKSTVDTYWIVISGASQIEAASWLLDDDERAVVLSSIASQAKRIAPTGYRVDRKGTAWVRVVSASRTPADGDVYSVEVDDLHTVVTSFGVVAHNCFPKDTRALVSIAERAGYDFRLLRGVIASNGEQHERMIDKVRAAVGGELAGRTVAAWGLSFKANTDDVRDSPAVAIVRSLIAEGASVRAYDPQAKLRIEGMEQVPSALGACDGSDALVVLTEWPEFIGADLTGVAARLRGKEVVDTRNVLDHRAATRAGLRIVGVGR